MLQSARALRNARALHRSGVRAFSTAEENYKNPIRPYREFTGDNVPAPQHGILGRLHGTWANWRNGPTGMHTTCMPGPGSNRELASIGNFVFKAQNYTERMTFTQVNEAVRNRGGSNEQFNGPMKYETTVIDTDGALQHFENGMYLWLGQNKQPWQDDDPYENPPTMMRHKNTPEATAENEADFEDPNAEGPYFIPPHSISRSGVIPHGTTIHITGKVTESAKDKEPLISELWDQRYLATDPSMGFNVEKDVIAGSLRKPEWTEQSRAEMFEHGRGRPYFSKLLTYDENGTGWPYTVQPNLKLSEANAGLNFKSYDLIELDSRHPTGIQGGVINNVMIERYCAVVRMRYRMWLQEVEDPALGRVVDQLQYEQIADFEFAFSSLGDKTKWPHIQVNTMRRLEDIPEADRLDEFILPTPDSAHH